MWSVKSAQGILGWCKNSFDKLRSEPGVKSTFKKSYYSSVVSKEFTKVGAN